MPQENDATALAQRSQSSLTPTADGNRQTSSPGGEKSKQETQQMSLAANEKDDIFVVDWDGPNDPENPKK